MFHDEYFQIRYLVFVKFEHKYNDHIFVAYNLKNILTFHVQENNLKNKKIN